ncbi:acylneuraminate cytidylyltransferase family protein [Cyanobium sp. Cruz CV11-17]|uniref:acylneuraminate cytidylyltransferase family protein n=1 Tax=Cyanobium sp. Cruz CV11-17 TaxID=2823709 RepID=UPI0020CF050A|nr:acylneuraminate cytidylyltransferase family protein [Cyanobium sp. Cruz CV11-17]MCP9901484.1 acylneuraminate cytidylyltransferase family protein [Cyanobium sp. Cruz CV11-17]
MAVRNVVALIPARSGSKGVPHKNIKSLGGHPLIEWSIKGCLKSGLIDRVIVSTDSPEYADLAVNLGAEAPFLRPAEIADDLSTDYDFVLHALDWFASHGGEPEFLVHIRPTTPYRAPALIDEAIEAFRDEPRATALRSVHEMSESAYKTFELAPAGQLKRLGADSTALDAANNARQQFPATYQANGYVDVLSSRFVRSHGLIHGDWVMPFITPAVVEVDTEDDFAHLEFLLARNPRIAHQLFT